MKAQWIGKQYKMEFKTNFNHYISTVNAYEDIKARHLDF